MNFQFYTELNDVPVSIEALIEVQDKPWSSGRVEQVPTVVEYEIKPGKAGQHLTRAQIAKFESAHNVQQLIELEESE